MKELLSNIFNLQSIKLYIVNITVWGLSATSIDAVFKLTASFVAIIYTVVKIYAEIKNIRKK